MLSRTIFGTLDFDFNFFDFVSLSVNKIEFCEKENNLVGKNLPYGK